MGSESNDGWWESLFRRGDWSQAEAWDEQLGSHKDRPIPGQADSTLKYAIYDERSGEEIFITLVCTCDTPVKGLELNSFFCPHCDRACERETRSCIVCTDYHLNFEDRIKMEDEDDDADL
jgi:hypothetical protein